MVGARLPDFRLETYFSEWEFKARFHLTASDAESMSVGELLELAGPGAAEELLGVHLGYIPTWGTDTLRQAIAATYLSCDERDVLTFAGAEEAIFWTMRLMAEPGDHVLVTVPNYQAMETIPLSAGFEVSGVLLDESRGWALDLDAVKDAIRPNTTVIAVNFPNNPTGAVPDHATWRDLFALCDERGVRVVSDEVYRGLERDPARTLTQAADMSPTAVSINVMSKAYGLPGLRVGWVSSRDRQTLALLERHKHYTSICNAGPSELLTTMALRCGERILARNRAIIAANTEAFDAFFADYAELFDWQAPDGGCVAFPRYHGGEGAEEFCRRLVAEKGVLVLPASLYHSELAPAPTDRFRIGLGRRDPQPALAAVREYLDER